DHEQHGLFGSFSPAQAGSPEGPAEAQVVVAAADIVQLDLAKLVKDITTQANAGSIAQDLQTLNMDVLALVQAEQLFAKDNDQTSALLARRTAHGPTLQAEMRALEAAFSELDRQVEDLA